MKIQKQKKFLKLQEIYDAVVGEVKSSSLSKILKEKTLLGIKVMRFCEKKLFRKLSYFVFNVSYKFGRIISYRSSEFTETCSSP